MKRLVFIIFMVALIAVAQNHHHGSSSTFDLVEQLQDGGLVLFVRHDRTSLEVASDQQPVDFSTCEGQRNLSSAGIESSKEVGQAIQILKIPVGRVLASPFCRTVQTAENIFGRGEATERLLGEKQSPMSVAVLVNEVATKEENGALVGHFNSLLVAKDIQLLEGEIAILKPDDQGGFFVVGRIPSGQWNDIIHDLDRRKHNKDRNNAHPADHQSKHDNHSDEVGAEGH